MSRPVSRRSLILQRLALVLALVFFLAPVLWLFSVAYKPASEVFSFPPRLFTRLTWENFRTIFGLFDIGRLVWSSIAISGGSTLLALLLGLPAGYALARSGLSWAPRVAYAFLAVRMVPPVATLIPYYLMMRDVGLLGSYGAVILIDATQSAGFVIWMMYAYFRGVPREVEDAAFTEGCSQIGAFLRIALPLVVPGLVASTLFCVMFSWNDFLFPAFLTTLETKPLSVALLSAYGTKDITWGTMGALAHFATLPIVVLALLLNRYFIQGLTRGIH